MSWVDANGTIMSVSILQLRREQGKCWFNENFNCPHPCALLCPPVGCVDLVAYENRNRKEN